MVANPFIQISPHFYHQAKFISGKKNRSLAQIDNFQLIPQVIDNSLNLLLRHIADRVAASQHCY